MDDRGALDTYRTLRAGMVVAGLLLGLGLLGYAVTSGHGVPPSISATYYTELQGIFVATLLAVGLALVGVKGRRGAENTLLDIAGVLIPLVGFVPTPIPDPSCPVPGRDCVPVALHGAIDLNMWAYLGAGLIALIVAGLRLGWAARTSEPWTASARRGLLLVVVLWVVCAASYLFVRPGFLQFAHYTSAITFFLLLIAVVWINGRQSLGRNDLAALSAAAYRRTYKTIATAMLVAVAGGVAVFLVTGNQNAVVGGRFPIVFWIEAVLLVLFVTYWVFQTIELWYYTVPPSA